jgi:diguanylate cyclase (GGDEF)-like protein
MTEERQLSDVLVEFARTMITDFPIQSILDHLVVRIVDVMPVSAAGVTLISHEIKPHFIAASNESALRFERLQSDLREGPCIAAYQIGTAVSAPDLRLDVQFPRFSPQALEAGLAAVFAFPLCHGSYRLGALDLYRDTPGALSTDAMIAAQTLADVASAYIINAEARADLQEASDQSRMEALHDRLTGLPNRVLMLERLEISFLRNRRSGLTSALLFIDLDRFKSVNDSFGHAVGDELLVAVANRLRDELRPGDTLARLSGDEFVVLCDELAHPALADGIARRFGDALARPFDLADVQLDITASVGIAYTGRDAVAPDELLNAADAAMYEAKRTGVGGTHHAIDLRDQNFSERQSGLKFEMPGLLDRHELYLDYQPIVTTADRCLNGAEALVRWSHPSRGIVTPDLLIPIAERLGLIREIGTWVLARALSDQQCWQMQPRVDQMGLSVNVSALQFMSPGFASTVANMLDESHTDPADLTLEMTESVFIGDGERAVVVFRELHDMGVRLALDDFGTGYSSLSYLLRFPVDIVKIDKIFVAGLGSDQASETLVAAVIGLAHGLGMTVIAEGVESISQYDELSSLGCDACQGFFFSHPIPARGFDQLLHHQAEVGDRSLPTLAA